MNTVLRRNPMDDPRQIPDSYWAATAPGLPPIPPFEGDLTAELAVIGGGFTGLSTGLHAAEARMNVVVLDAHEPGWGASGRNMGHVVAALKHEPAEIEDHFGRLRGQRLIDAVGGGPDLVFSLIERYAIACNAQRKGIITAAHSRASLDALDGRTRVWVDRGAPLQMIARDALREATGTDYYYGASFDPRGGAINPLGFARGLARAAMSLGARLYSDAFARSIERGADGWIIRLDRGTVRAQRIVIGTNGYTGDLWPGLKKTILPARTPQLVSEVLDPVWCKRILPNGEAMSDTRLLTVGVRLHPDGRLHMGGGGGTSGAVRTGPYENLRRRAAELFPFLPRLKWEYRWTGFMGMTPDRYPRLFELAPGVAAAMGYSGRGVAMATILGKELAHWAGGRASIGELALPASHAAPLPYHMAVELAVELGLIYYRARDRLAYLGR